MRVQYVNQQDKLDPMNGVVFAEGRRLVELLDSRRGESPFTARLSGDNGFELMVGIGRKIGCAQYSRSDGVPPYLMAVPARAHMTSGHAEFLMGGTPTPIPAHHILSFDELKAVALHFLETGEPSTAVTWASV